MVTDILVESENENLDEGFIRDLLHNLDPENTEHILLYNQARYYYIRHGEKKVPYAYDDRARRDKDNKPIPINKIANITGKITVGIGFNMDDKAAREFWNNAFRELSDKELRIMNVLNADDFFDKVKNGQRNLTSDQIDKLFNTVIDKKKQELTNIYGAKFLSNLRLNELLAIEDAYYNKPLLVNKKSDFFKCIHRYYKTGNLDDLEKAVAAIKDSKEKNHGLRKRRNSEGEILSSFKSQFYSRVGSLRLPKVEDVGTILAKINETVIPRGTENWPKSNNTKYYIWRTRGDDKVRFSHFLLEGKIFSDDHPPAEGWEPGNTKIHCRCHKQRLPANVVVTDDEIQGNKNNFLLPPTTNFNFNNLRSDYMKTTAPTPLNSEHLVYRNQAWEQLKGLSDERTKQIERSGYVDALTEQKWQKINCEVDEQKARLDSLEAAMNRPAFAMSGENADQQNAEYKAAFVEYLRKGNLPQASSLEKKFLSVGSETDGGHFVDKEVSKQIVKKIEANSIMRKLASIEEVSTHVLEVLEDDGALESGWVAEIEPRDDTEAPKLNKRRIEVHEVYAQPKATQKLIDDSKVDIANWLMEKIADKFADVESEAFINGDGVGKPRGILSLPHGKDRNSIEQISLLGSELSADDIMNLYYSLPSKYAARASFLMHRNMLQKIRTLKCPNTGHYIWAPGLAVGQPDTLLGAPVYESPHMPIPASGALAIAFADFKQAYKIVDRTNINIIRDPFTEKPFVKFYATKRVGGSVINSGAMKLLKAA